MINSDREGVKCGFRLVMSYEFMFFCVVCCVCVLLALLVFQSCFHVPFGLGVALIFIE